MIKNYTRIVCLLLLLFAFLPSIGQVKFYARSNDKTISKNDVVQVEFVVENATSIKDFAVPPFKNFNVLSGPNPSSTTTSINGKTTSSYALGYMLQPTAAGLLSIPPATAIINGNTIKTASIVIKVSATGNANSSNTQQTEGAGILEDYILKPGENIQDKINNNMMVLLDVNKTTCYEGEPIVATYKLCSRLRSDSRLLKRPTLNGFSVYDIIDNNDAPLPTVETINGKQFNVHIIRKVQLYPQQPGNFVLDAVELDNSVQLLKQDKTNSSSDAMQDAFDRFMNPERGEWITQKVTLASKEVSINVKPLPAKNRSDSFNGAVGNFTISSQLKNAATIKTGEAFEFEIKLSGEGNFPLITTPVLSFPGGIYSEEPLVKEELDKTVAPIQGSKFFTYSIYANTAGNYTLPAVSFIYFDTKKNTYKTITTKPIHLNVVQDNNKPPNKKNNIIALPINTQPFPLWILIGIVTLLAAVVTGFFATRKKTTRQNQQATSPVTLVDAPVIYKPVFDYNDASNALQNNNSIAFYSELYNTTWLGIAQLLNSSPNALSKPTAVAMLRNKGLNETQLNNLQQLLSRCEQAKYTPMINEEAMKDDLQQAMQVSKLIENLP
jgi:BatD DUF11 like domain